MSRPRAVPNVCPHPPGRSKLVLRQHRLYDGAMTSFAAIILCGGKSVRMGTPKAFLLFDGETLLVRIVRRLQEVAAPVVVVAAPGQELPPLPAMTRVVRDDEEGRGPLQGLATGLAAIEGEAEVAYVSACDVPFVDPAFAQRIIDLLGNASISVPYVHQRYHPLSAAYRIDVLPIARQLLASGQLAVRSLFETVPTRIVTEAELTDVDPTLESLRNLNIPGDYLRALNDVQQAAPG